jgi:hypothetical protein
VADLDEDLSHPHALGIEASLRHHQVDHASTSLLVAPGPCAPGTTIHRSVSMPSPAARARSSRHVSWVSVMPSALVARACFLELSGKHDRVGPFTGALRPAGQLLDLSLEPG